MKKVSQLQLVKKNKQAGAGLIEYAVIAALVVAIALAGFTLMGPAFTAAFTKITAALNS